METDRCIPQGYRLVCPVEAAVVPGLKLVSTGVRVLSTGGRYADLDVAERYIKHSREDLLRSVYCSLNVRILIKVAHYKFYILGS